LDIFDFKYWFLAFIILLTAVGRDYSFMKVIYIYMFSGISTALIPLLKGFDLAVNFLKKNKVGF